MSRKFTYKDVKQYFKDHDCELLEKEYINAHTRMRYRCKCGNSKCKITFSKFKSGQRCMECSGNKKFTYKEVKQYFKEYDCELLETEYINSQTPMRYKCDCGNSKCKTTFNNFQSGHRCNECAIKRRADKKRFKFEEVKQYFEDHDCKLLEKVYVDSKTLMRYECDCGNDECKIRFSSFRNGTRCMECSGNKTHTFKFVKQYFEDHDCELMETEYINSNTKMRYRCKCGNDKCKITFDSFKAGHKCRECANERLRKERQFSFKEVQKYFEDHDCELLEKVYVNNSTLMKYECDCGNRECKIRFSSFKQGQRCNKCAIKRMSGENHPNYNPNLTDEEREKGRYIHGMGKWVKDIYEKNYYTCQCCFKVGGKLIAHHIESYGSNEELRIVVSNGITFCEEHHIEFHKKYGYGNNTREQLNEFLSFFAEIIKIDERNR